MSIHRNKIILAHRAEGMSYDQIKMAIASEFKLSTERIRQICVGHKAKSQPATFAVEDFKALRAMTAKYGLKLIIFEVARIAGNYGNTAPRWALCAKKLRLAVLHCLTEN